MTPPPPPPHTHTHTPSIDTYLYGHIFPNPFFKNIFLKISPPIKFGMNTKTNACGKVFSSCSDDYKKLYYMFFYKQHVYIH